MAKPRLPWGPKPQRPGVGLNLFSPEEVPTLKRLVLPEEPPTSRPPNVPAPPPPTEAICPLCSGAGELHTTPYAKSTCPLCSGSTSVPRDVFETWLTEHPHSLAARQLTKGAKK